MTFFKKAEKSAIDRKRDAMVNNLASLIDAKLKTMGDIYGKDVLLVWLEAVEDKIHSAANDSTLIDNAHTLTRATNIW